MVEKQYSITDFPTFNKRAYYPNELKARFNSLVVTAFDDSMTVEMQMRVMKKIIEENAVLFDELINYFNDLVDDFNALQKWFFDTALPQILVDILLDWLENGMLADIINQQLLLLPFVNVNTQPRLAPEVTDTGRIQRTIDKMDRGILVFDGTYDIGNIVGKGNIRYIGTTGTKFNFTDNADGFYFDKQHNWEFSGIEWNGEKQRLGSNYFVRGYNCNNVVLEKNVLRDGAYGFSLENTKNSRMDKNFATGFRYWALVVFGCDGFSFNKNTSNSGAYDGLKCAGVESDVAANLHKDLVVSENICLFNARDGFDIAGNNIESAKVFNNIFNNNGVNGIDFKMVYQGLFMKDVEIYNNTTLFNATHQINLQINILLATAENVYVHDNNIAAIGTTGGTAGMRIYGFKENIIVEQNNIKEGQFGIRLLDTSHTTVRNNEILGSNIGIEVSTQVYPEMVDNLIKNNVIKSISTPVRITSAAVKRTEVDGNDVEVELDTFIISDLGTDTVFGRNYTGYTTGKPTGRGTQGEIKKERSLGFNKPLEWISLNTNGAANWIPVGMVENITTWEIASLTVPEIAANGFVSVSYQQIPCQVGDLLSVTPLTAFASDVVVFSAYIAAQNKIVFTFINGSGAPVNISGMKWKVLIEKRA